MSRQPLPITLLATVARRGAMLPVKSMPAILLVGAFCAATLLGVPGATAASGTATGSGLKPIDQHALQAVVNRTARELHLPGALVLLRTPQGKFTAAYGTTRLGSRSRPRPHTYFRIASITKTMTSAVILQLAQEGKLRLGRGVVRAATAARRPDLEVRLRRAEWQQHHLGRAARNAQRPLRLYQFPQDGGLSR